MRTVISQGAVLMGRWSVLLICIHVCCAAQENQKSQAFACSLVGRIGNGG